MLEITRARPDEYVRVSREILAQVMKNRDGAKYVDLYPILCDERVCWARKGGQPLYRNNDHLSSAGALIVGATLLETQSLETWLVSKVTASVPAEAAGDH